MEIVFTLQAMKKLAVIVLLFSSYSVVAQKFYSVEKFQENKAFRKDVRREFSMLCIANSEVSDITFGDLFHPDNRHFAFNTNIVPNFYLTPLHWPVVNVGTPTVRIRMLTEYSAPIRTPSFNPGGWTFFQLRKNRNLDNFRYLAFGFFHHSNGQDGVAINPDGSINLRNGNFSDNYINFDFHFGRQHNQPNASARNFAKLGLEIHGGLFKIGDEPLLRDMIGNWRVNFRLGRTSYSRDLLHFFRNTENDSVKLKDAERFRLVLDGTVILDKMKAAITNTPATWNQYFNLELKFYYNIPHSENMAMFFSTGYMGHDYYNVYFWQPYPFVRFGLAGAPAFMFSKRLKGHRKDMREKF
ncbi:MAG: hypothetical protein POELPBGB_01973 [Bacteroidia bacterium]|nr:hypothetical protein [Bacteroidia bacterium]